LRDTKFPSNSFERPPAREINIVQNMETKIKCPKCSTSFDWISKRRCPKCSSELIFKKSRYGKFIGCSHYPTCKYTEDIEIRVQCPKCGSHLVLRSGRSLKTRLSKDKPKKCSICGTEFIPQKPYYTFCCKCALRLYKESNAEKERQKQEIEREVEESRWFTCHQCQETFADIESESYWVNYFGKWTLLCKDCYERLPDFFRKDEDDKNFRKYEDNENDESLCE